MTKKWKIALCQSPCEEGNKESNLQKIEMAIEKAYKDKADILVLPEMFLTGFVSKAELLQLAETREGESLKRVQRKLRDFPVHLVYSFPEYAGENIVYNTTCIIHKNTTPLEFYRKVHLFDEERNIVNRGQEFIEVTIENVKVGILTCYDVEFPEAARKLALKGVKLIVIPTANMLPYDLRHKVFIVSRALENHVFVAYCNRVGRNKRFEYHGDSSVVDPNGKVLMELSGNKESFGVCEIDFNEIEKSKSIFNYLEERRAELY